MSSRTPPVLDSFAVFKPQDVDVVLDDLAVGGRNAHQVASVSASARRPSTIYWFNNEGWTPETYQHWLAAALQ
jgi:hypothetical protein